MVGMHVTFLSNTTPKNRSPFYRNNFAVEFIVRPPGVFHPFEKVMQIIFQD